MKINLLSRSGGTWSEDKKEFIVSAHLRMLHQGDKQIAHDWAFHKVYYLISELKYNENNVALIKAINDLSAKFHITTPYSLSVSASPARETQKRVTHKVVNPLVKK